MTKATKKPNFLKTRIGFFITAVLTFVAVWLVFLRASHTGSLQQYAVMLVFIYFGFDRLFRTIRGV